MKKVAEKLRAAMMAKMKKKKVAKKKRW